MKMVQDPRHAQRAVHSVSVAGREYFLDNGTVDGIPDHLAKEFEGHGFMPEGQYVMFMAQEAEKDRARIAQEERDEETRLAVKREHMDSIAQEERVRVQARFAEEARLRSAGPRTPRSYPMNRSV